MGAEGVMVSYHHSGPEESAGIVTVSASGIKFARRWVVTHGSVLAPLRLAGDISSARGKPILNDRFYDTLPEMYITCERAEQEDDATQRLTELSAQRSRDPHLDHASYQVRVLTGRVCHVWQCPLLERCVSDILYSWTIGYRDLDLDAQTDLGKTLLSVFILIDLDSHVRDTKPLRPLSELLDLVKAPPDRGSTLQVHSTPFGCEVLLNSVTRGAVCGVVGSRPSLLLTDASTALGSEGAPVYAEPRADQDGEGGCVRERLVGMVVCSVSWWRGEWVGLTLVAPLKAVLHAKLRIAPSAVTPTVLTDPALSEILRCIDLTTVLVRCGDSWGAGVYLGRGYVLTCAHVVRRHATEKVSVYCGGTRATAILRYKTRDELAYDLALLFTNPDSWPHLRPANFATALPVKGEPVVAAGYPYFSEKNMAELKATVTSGHISNVSPSMIQTSCCVQSGFSGGAIYRIRGDRAAAGGGGEACCEVVGVVVSNAKTQQTNACFPYINMAVPAQVFHPAIAQYLLDKREDSLRALERREEMIQSQWRLMPYRSKI